MILTTLTLFAASETNSNPDVTAGQSNFNQALALLDKLHYSEFAPFLKEASRLPSRPIC